MKRLDSPREVAALGAVIGVFSVLLVVALTIGWIYLAGLILNKPGYMAACIPLAVFHIPVAAAEAVITSLVMYALTVSKPDVLVPIYGEYIIRLARLR